MSTEFDLDRYMRASKKIDLQGVEWDRVADHPVTTAEARCLTYMMDIESHTVVFLRDLLATEAVFDPDVTAFLSCWVYEELWHGEAFSRFLGEAGYELGPNGERPGGETSYPTRTARNAWIRRALGRGDVLTHLGIMAASKVIGEDFVAVHMTWGAVNELATLTGYHQLIARTENPVLVDLLRRIIMDERRHFAFYRAQACMRLARSRRARAVTRWAMKHLWSPVGTGVRPQSETDFVITALFGGEDGRSALADTDATISALPGLEGLEIFADALAGARRRQGSTEEGFVADPDRGLATPTSPKAQTHDVPEFVP
jgi:rubrerythrin